MYLPRFFDFLGLSAYASQISLQEDAAIERRSTVPTVASIVQLGSAYDPNFPNVYRDNGGGGNLNGINFIVFADTGVTNGGPNGALTWFVSNSIAAIDYVRPSTCKL
jgi:hypothetical protein